MAHTMKGNLTGRAASTEKRDIREYVQSIEEKSEKERLEQEQTFACLRCIDLEGAEEFWKWFDDDSNVPSVGTIQSRINLINIHMKELEFNLRYTIVDRLLGDSCVNIQKIADVAEVLNVEEQ